MRRWFVAFCMLGVVTQANAQDFETPTLRGSSPYIPAPYIPAVPTFVRWAGVYGGGQVGFASSNMDFRDAFDSASTFNPAVPLTAPLGRVSSWAAFTQRDVQSSSYGAFIGYNAQWDDAVFGVEVNYSHSNLSGSSVASRCYSDSNPLCRASIPLGDGNTYNATIDAAASARITDYTTFRGRGGWAAGNFMPYAMVGIAVARAEVTRSATVNATPTGAGAPFTLTESDTKTRFTWGYSLGGGVDFLVTPNVFVRAEYEFIKLNPVNDVSLTINTARAAAGLKF